MTIELLFCALGAIVLYFLIEIFTTPSTNYYDSLTARRRIQRPVVIRNLEIVEAELKRVVEEKEDLIKQLKAIEDDRELYVDVVQDYCKS